MPMHRRAVTAYERASAISGKPQLATIELAQAGLDLGRGASRPALQARRLELKTTTFSGRRLSRQQISEIQKTVALLPGNTRSELSKTTCQHLNWKSEKGSFMVGACLGMLEHLECRGIVKLPPKRESMVRNAPALRRAHFRPRK